jgi:glycosyltransferase involved in cell wall biosynthesis
MRIAYIAAGAAGMYCGSCLHDNTLAAGLMSRGHDVALIPTYTPLRTDESDVTNEPIFYGAINVYLRQKAGFYRRAPAFLNRLLDRPALLRWVSRFAASTDARDLGALTLSILQAEEGRQQEELQRLLQFLESFQPDLVQLTNAMFLGIGASIRAHLGIPVVSGLTGEDLFMEELPSPFRQQVETEMRRRAQEVDGFIATSHYYAAAMRRFLDVESDRMHVVPLGINFENFASSRTADTEDGITLGYLARICPEKGLHHLVDAFRILRSDPDGQRIRLKIAGYLGARDAQYYDEQKRRIAAWDLSEAVDFLGEVDRHQKMELLHSIDLLSVPTTYKEPKGLFVLEGWAAGTPSVLPRHGAFPELIEGTGGGLLVEPHSPEDLARGLRHLIDVPQERLARGQKGRAAVESDFNTQVMTQRTETVYQNVIDAARSSSEKGAQV